ncbi:MAG: hypothetical protein IPG74_03430 [Flavobacteriales bacterium]|nr:hypothetical protein [Flavobacteriales bacterium]
MPVARSVDQELLLRAGVRMQELDTLGQSIVCQDPMITYAAGRDPFDRNAPAMIWAVDKSQEGLGLGTGDLLVGCAFRAQRRRTSAGTGDERQACACWN